MMVLNLVLAITTIVCAIGWFGDHMAATAMAEYIKRECKLPTKGKVRAYVREVINGDKT